jgi:protein-S-isoprenylcysteine O-methyltransferase Ste14
MVVATPCSKPKEKDHMKIGVLAALTSGLIGAVITGLLLFLPAGTFHYWQAWVFMAIFSITTTVPNIYLAMRQPDTLRRRMRAGYKAETRPVQKAASVGYFAIFGAVAVLSALDHRFGWSNVPTSVVWAGQALVAVGLLLAMLAVLQNRFAASRVAVESDQRVVSTGMYGFVRHPMYLGLLIMMIGAPLALDSYWGLTLFLPGVVLFAVRILDEEKLLRADLPGYDYYAFRVRSRLVPGIW